MKFKGTFRCFRISLEKYRQLVHEELSEAIAHAAFEWMQAVLAEIPVWSGASHATFLRLSREVGFNLSISPSVISRIPYGQRHGDGEVIADRDKGLYLFKYETTLEHLIFNEQFNANLGGDPKVFHRLRKPGPYQFQEKGQAAFRDFAANVQLPSPWNTLKVKVYRVS
jgi:hypothetical protein